MLRQVNKLGLFVYLQNKICKSDQCEGPFSLKPNLPNNWCLQVAGTSLSSRALRNGNALVEEWMMLSTFFAASNPGPCDWSEKITPFDPRNSDYCVYYEIGSLDLNCVIGSAGCIKSQTSAIYFEPWWDESPPDVIYLTARSSETNSYFHTA